MKVKLIFPLFYLLSICHEREMGAARGWASRSWEGGEGKTPHPHKCRPDTRVSEEWVIKKAGFLTSQSLCPLWAWSRSSTTKGTEEMHQPITPTQKCKYSSQDFLKYSCLIIANAVRIISEHSNEWNEWKPGVLYISDSSWLQLQASEIFGHVSEKINFFLGL